MSAGNEAGNTAAAAEEIHAGRAPAGVSDELKSPLARFGGEPPPAPDWFVSAVAVAPRRSFVEVEGTSIETLEWGRPDDPGLVLLHGRGAHADWWDFIAPMFAAGYHVVAPSWSGMGRSGWREGYSVEQHAREALAVIDATGLFSARRKPVVVAHSYGGLPLLSIAANEGRRLRAAVFVDSPLISPSKAAVRQPQRLQKGDAPRVYPTLAAALARFRFMPLQPCGNAFIADHIARHSLKRVEEPQAGWTWRFDPRPWIGRRTGVSPGAFAAIGCAYGLITGQMSRMLDAEDAAWLREAVGPAIPWTVVEGADHHVMVDRPLVFVDALKSMLALWP